VRLKQTEQQQFHSARLYAAAIEIHYFMPATVSEILEMNCLEDDRLNFKKVA